MQVQELMRSVARTTRHGRGDGRALLVALGVFALLALVAAAYLSVLPVPLARGSAPAEAKSAAPPAAERPVLVAAGTVVATGASGR